jgi:HAD superfamily hydrolase (TIGR01509 family)
MIKAVIFDLNGVFMLSPKLSDRFESDFNVSKEIFLPALSEIMDKVRKPNADPAFNYWKPCIEEWGINFDEKQFWDYWFNAETESPEMIALAKELKQKGIKVIILSNNFKERTNFYQQYPSLKEAADKFYYSWQTGFIKPDPGAWRNVLEDNNLKPEECIYFDDQDKNLKAAESLGIKAHMFVDAITTKEILKGEIKI